MQNLRANRGFSITQIHLLCAQLNPLNGNAIDTFMDQYDQVMSGPLLAVVNTCREAR